MAPTLLDPGFDDDDICPECGEELDNDGNGLVCNSCGWVEGDDELPDDERPIDGG